MLQLVINSELSVSKTRLAPRRLSHIHPSVSQVWLSTQQQTVVDTTQTTGDQSDRFWITDYIPATSLFKAFALDDSEFYTSKPEIFFHLT